MIDKRAFGKPWLFYVSYGLDALAPLVNAYARSRSNGPISEPHNWRKGLILGSHHIGDVLWRTNSLHQLKRGLPGCEWYYLASPYSAPILDGNPFLSGILPYYYAHKVCTIMPGKQRHLREMQFDVALCTEKNTYLRQLLTAVRLGIPNRVCYTYKGLGHLVTYPMPIQYPQPFPAYIRDFVAHLIGVKSDWALEPKIYFKEADTQEALSFMAKNGLKSGDPFIGIFPRGRTSARWITQSQLLGLMQRILDRGIQVALCGAKEDEDFLKGLATKASGNVILCAGLLGLKGLAAFIKHCCLVFCADSAARHIANAVGTPVIFLRAAQANEKESGVYCAGEQDLLPLNTSLSNPFDAANCLCCEPDSILNLIVTSMRADPHCQERSA